MKVPVSQLAVISRLRRYHKAQGEQFCVTRGRRALQDVGQYYVIDPGPGIVIQSCLDLETHARAVGALGPAEELID
jgi:hypothetical protein